ncbi:Ribonuclease 2, partial [Frankliniella fusca]
MEMEELLSSWGLDAATIKIFVDEKMDLLTLRHMDQESYRALIKSEGMRIRFKVFHSKWVKELDAKGVLSECYGGSDAKSIPEGCRVIAVSDFNGNLSSFPENFMADDEMPFDAKENEDNDTGLSDSYSEKSNNTVEKNDGAVGDDSLKFLEDSFEKANPQEKSHDSRTGEESTKEATGDALKLKETLKDATGSHQNLYKKMKTYDLENVLNSTSVGKRVISQYKQSNMFIKDSYRDNLVECVLEEETRDDLGKVISHDRLKFLAEKIAELFPEELVKTYYEVYRHPKSKKMITKGKLVWRYYNRRRDFAHCGAISKDDKHKASGTVTQKTSTVVDKSTAGSLCWLEANRGNKGNWQEVLRHWRATSAVRMDRLKAGVELDESDEEENDGAKSKQRKKKKKLTKEDKRKLELRMEEQSAHQYMQKYPAFHENTAYMLFEIDFKELRPDVESLALFTEWTTLSAFIVEQVQKTDATFLQDPTLTAGEKNLMLLRNMSKLFPIVSVPGSRKTTEEAGRKVTKVWRPSHAEVADAFVLLTHSALALEEEKDEKRSQLQKLRMHMQPFVAVVGEIDNPSQYLICVDEFFYEVDSPLQAVDLVFKSFFALNTRYPSEAEQVWLFLQRAVYGFRTDEDSSFAGVDLR